MNTIPTHVDPAAGRRRLRCVREGAWNAHQESEENQAARHVFFRITLAALALIVSSCATRNVAPPQSPGTLAAQDKPYMDLQPGPNLRIVVPLLKSEGFVAKFDVVADDGQSNLTLSSHDVIGYTTSNFAVKGTKGGPVRLELLSTEETRDGKTLPRPVARKLPFALPPGAAYIRLLYLIHYSEADHGLAILWSKRLETLDAFTRRMIQNPGVCAERGNVSCALVPAGIGVRNDGS